ncbi:hypothetical protein [Scytonema millei]|uniref:Uncharacterized protein n=1 Tax=Scytonema millei VB511283 TaxID=1245923 RepID=A0A9X5EA49_9CYAN|nr:hypothetical protein [Scytonema millei]NHC36904.1 hypothetical protein [Scytonema millei VB511283]
MNKRQQEARKAIAWSTDALIPGIYVWLGNWLFRLGGTEAQESYPGTIHSKFGLAVVLPGYHIWTTYQGSYDPE